jgi:hypothetical protein
VSENKNKNKLDFQKESENGWLVWVDSSRLWLWNVSREMLSGSNFRKRFLFFFPFELHNEKDSSFNSNDSNVAQFVFMYVFIWK